MDGRLFGGQRVEAYIADGHERFKKTKKADAAAEEDEEEEGAGEAKGVEGRLEDDEETEQKHQEEFKKWSEQQKASKLGVAS